MTLIYSSVGNGTLAISDVLISSPASSAPPVIALPFQLEPFSHTSGNWTLSGVTQKMILAKNTLLLWSGSVAVSRAVVQKALEISDGGQDFIDFPVFLEGLGLTENELSQVGLIYHFLRPEGPLRYAHNTQRQVVANQQIAYDGSGGWDFVSDTTIVRTDANVAPREFHLSMLSKCVYKIIQEGWTKENYDYLYGGWFEVASDEGGVVQKWPLAIKFWSIDERGLRIDLPLFFSFYDDDDLVVCRADISGAGSSVSVHMIEAIHRRNPAKDRPSAIRWEPKLVCHVINHQGSDTVSAYIRFNVPDEMRVEIDPSSGRMTNQFSKSLTELLMSGAAEGMPGFSIEKASSPAN